MRHLDRLHVFLPFATDATGQTLYAHVQAYSKFLLGDGNEKRSSSDPPQTARLPAESIGQRELFRRYYSNCTSPPSADVRSNWMSASSERVLKGCGLGVLSGFRDMLDDLILGRVSLSNFSRGSDDFIVGVLGLIWVASAFLSAAIAIVLKVMNRLMLRVTHMLTGFMFSPLPAA